MYLPERDPEAVFHSLSVWNPFSIDVHRMDGFLHAFSVSSLVYVICQSYSGPSSQTRPVFIDYQLVQPSTDSTDIRRCHFLFLTEWYLSKLVREGKQSTNFQSYLSWQFSWNSLISSDPLSKGRFRVILSLEL
mmetsp:Transcript_8519/g.15425  ORF Transcript_8519/g.15425 Transcript_8519/m.15425 type:complete len:133 (+) Transcript_8519:1003-1401(+)